MAKKERELNIVEGLKTIFTLKGMLAIGLMSFALTSFLTTFDLIPDTLGFAGKIDDVALILLGFWAAKDLMGFIEDAVKKPKKK